ncbi:hypothetical protein E2C01_046970 [Portunus trituberculatus]|uniref:Uncharacterized protein n=1 Tax=Portunus trituberculatus TaxID=210409 RepID=A0A5B7G6B4_PORTR|nr:hypothetical protein [Portunus trituberculatus]
MPPLSPHTQPAVPPSRPQYNALFPSPLHPAHQPPIPGPTAQPLPTPVFVTPSVRVSLRPNTHFRTSFTTTITIISTSISPLARSPPSPRHPCRSLAQPPAPASSSSSSSAVSNTPAKTLKGSDGQRAAGCGCCGRSAASRHVLRNNDGDKKAAWNERETAEHGEEIAVVKECDGKEAGEEQKEEEARGGEEERKEGRRHDRGGKEGNALTFPATPSSSPPCPCLATSVPFTLSPPVNPRPCTCQVSSTPLTPTPGPPNNPSFGPLVTPSFHSSPLPPPTDPLSPAANTRVLNAPSFRPASTT